jgi:hypothetical protein
MHGAINTSEGKDRRYEAHKKAQSSTFVSTLIEEQSPNIIVPALVGRHDCDEYQQDDEE